jgi:hypothetical protein
VRGEMGVGVGWRHQNGACLFVCGCMDWSGAGVNIIKHASTRLGTEAVLVSVANYHPIRVMIPLGVESWDVPLNE